MTFVRAGLVLFVCLILQLTLLADLRVSGVAAQLMLAVAVSAGLTGGSQRGAVFGFVAGLLIDLYLPTPFGLSAAAYAFAAGLMGLAFDAVMERSLLTLVGFPALGTGIGLVVFVMGAFALGHSEVYGPRTGGILVTVVLWNSLLGFVLIPVTRWMWDAGWDRDGARSVERVRL